MARYGWRPRDYLVTPANFGRFSEVAWKTPEGDPRLNQALPSERGERAAVVAARRDRDRLRVAQWQHSVAYQVREGAHYRDLSTEDLAAQMRVGVDSLRRLLRGDGPMEVEDFAALLRLVGAHPFQDLPQGRADTQSEP